jgi:SAM-dependent methyltransferase
VAPASKTISAARIGEIAVCVAGPYIPVMAARERRFRSTVPHYLAGRLRYPPPLIAAVAAAVGLEGSGRVLDLGCGPGFLAIAFARHAAEVVAVDPEPDMLAAARAAAGGEPGRIGFVLAGSEQLGPQLGRFDLVTIGRAFHWMDRERTLVALDALVEPAGGVALFADRHPEAPENAWRPGWLATRERFAERDPRLDHRDHETVLRRSAFAEIRHLTEHYRRAVTVDELVARALSTSTTSPDVLGAVRAEFEAAIRAAVAPYARDGALTEVVEAEALLATRPGLKPMAVRDGIR